MKVAYGPPGARGVTHLMAVGADDVDGAAGASDRMLRGGIAASAVAIGIGYMMGSSTLRTGAIGGLLALVAIRALSRKTQTVAVTQPVVAGW